MRTIHRLGNHLDNKLLYPVLPGVSSSQTNICVDTDASVLSVNSAYLKLSANSSSVVVNPCYLVCYLIYIGLGVYGMKQRSQGMLQGRFNLKAIAHLPEAADMIKGMLAPDPRKRPSIRGIMQQPLWWSPACRLAFPDSSVRPSRDGRPRGSDQ